MIDLRQGDWRQVLADVECDSVVSDPPYSELTHSGQQDNRRDPYEAKQLSYAHFTPADVHSFVTEWAPRTRRWFAIQTDSELAPHWREAYEAAGFLSFAPVPCVMKGMTCRMTGDGPSSWCVWLMVARRRSLEMVRWGTLPGAYIGVPTRAKRHIGGKPEWLMRAIVRDYSRPGDLVCDPCAGWGTTLTAATALGRRAVGAEIDPQTYQRALERIGAGVQTELAI